MCKVRKVNVNHWRLLTTHLASYILPGCPQNLKHLDLLPWCHDVRLLSHTDKVKLSLGKVRMRYLWLKYRAIMSCHLSIIVVIEKITNYNCDNSQPGIYKTI